MKKILVLLAFFFLFCQMRADKGTQVITNFNKEDPNTPYGGDPRGTVTLPEVFQNDLVFTTDTYCYGHSLRLVSNDIVAYETIVNLIYGGVYYPITSSEHTSCKLWMASIFIMEPFILNDSY